MTDEIRTARENDPNGDNYNNGFLEAAKLAGLVGVGLGGLGGLVYQAHNTESMSAYSAIMIGCVLGYAAGFFSTLGIQAAFNAIKNKIKRNSSSELEGKINGENKK